MQRNCLKLCDFIDVTWKNSFQSLEKNSYCIFLKNKKTVLNKDSQTELVASGQLYNAFINPLLNRLATCCYIFNLLFRTFTVKI